MLVVRAALLLGWFVLIASLFWDPSTTALTRPGNLVSPFRITTPLTMVRGVTVEVQPYQLSNRIFWTMVVPVLPLFMMVFGHEAWRRICPLSFASQLPRYFGLQRRRATLNRRTGRVAMVPALVTRNAWLHRNAWYVQIGFLFAGLGARLLFINSSRIGLAIALMGVIAAAIAVGYLWGGKTWCNYICPANIVQRIYTEPRGILESAPHIRHADVSQSTCRTPGRGGDKSACVGCLPQCGDIDLERAYWETIEEPARRNVYYMFAGLVAGFYGYYYLYAGSWDYYFSGIWTHEDQFSSLLQPGLLIANHTIPIPKLVAAPLVLALAAFAALALGRLLEHRYRQLRRSWKPLSHAEITNHCLAFSGYATINLFYVFAGRPNIVLMPEPVIRCIDILIFALSTLWLWQALQRSPFRYRRESVASSLIEQLKKLKLDVSKYFDGRSLDQLKPDEVYVLSKVLPAISHEQKMTAYRNILDDATATGKTNSGQFLEILGELRAGMGVSDEEHTQMLELLGVSSEINFDAQKATSHEKAVCLANYSAVVGTTIANQIEGGRTLEAAVEQPDVKATISILRSSLQISDADHAQLLGRLASAGGVLTERMSQQFDMLKDLLGAKFCLHGLGGDDAFWCAFEVLATDAIERRVAAIRTKLLSIMRVLGNMQEVRWCAANLVRLAGDDMGIALARPVAFGADMVWEDALDRQVAVILLGKSGPASLVEAPDGARPCSFRDVIKSGLDLQRNLRILAQDDDPVMAAIALTATSYLDPDMARDLAETICGPEGDPSHWLLSDVVRGIMAPAAGERTRPLEDGLRLTVVMPDGARAVVTSGNLSVTVGRAPGNDVVLNDRRVAPYHLAIHRQLDDIRIVLFDDLPVYANRNLCQAETTVIATGSQIAFAASAEAGPVIGLERLSHRDHYSLQHCDTVTKLVWLSRDRRFQALDLSALARIAASAEVRRYASGALLCRDDQPISEAFFLQAGTAEIVSPPSSPAHPQATSAQMLHAGDSYGSLSANAQPADFASVRITSDFAIVIVLPRRQDCSTASQPALPFVFRARSDLADGMEHVSAGALDMPA